MQLCDTIRSRNAEVPLAQSGKQAALALVKKLTVMLTSAIRVKYPPTIPAGALFCSQLPFSWDIPILVTQTVFSLLVDQGGVPACSPFLNPPRRQGSVGLSPARRGVHRVCLRGPADLFRPESARSAGAGFTSSWLRQYIPVVFSVLFLSFGVLLLFFKPGKSEK